MSILTQPLRDEHKELMSHVEILLRVADSVGTAPVSTLLQGVDQVYQFLSGHLVPHARAEDRALYPYVGRVMGAPEATATMSRDHIEIERLVGQLANIRAQVETEPLNAFRANELRRILYGLYALVKVHFAKEEEVYLPILDARATLEGMQRVYQTMKQAAKAA